MLAVSTPRVPVCFRPLGFNYAASGSGSRDSESECAMLSSSERHRDALPDANGLVPKRLQGISSVLPSGQGLLTGSLRVTHGGRVY